MRYLIYIIMLLLMVFSVFSAPLTKDEVGDIIPQYLTLEGEEVIAPNIGDQPFSLSDFFGSLTFFSGEPAVNSKCALYSWSQEFGYTAYNDNGVGTQCLDGQFVVPFYASTGNLIFSEIWFKSSSSDRINFNDYFTRSQTFTYYYGCYNCVQLKIEATNKGCLTDDKRDCVTAIDPDCDKRYIYEDVCRQYVLEDECSTLGQKQCVGDTLKVCGLKDGYKQLIIVETCDYECSGGECIPEPQECSSTRRCSGDDVETCFNGEWSYLKTCDDGCTDGVCDTAVTPDCTSGDTRCIGTLQEECVAGQWSQTDSNACATTNDECSSVGQEKCSAGAVVTCTDVGGVLIYKTTEQCDEICANTPSGAECQTQGGFDAVSYWNDLSTTNKVVIGVLFAVVLGMGILFVTNRKKGGGL